jgi:hypothetical protein
MNNEFELDIWDALERTVINLNIALISNYSIFNEILGSKITLNDIERHQLQKNADSTLYAIEDTLWYFYDQPKINELLENLKNLGHAHYKRGSLIKSACSNKVTDDSENNLVSKSCVKVFNDLISYLQTFPTVEERKNYNYVRHLINNTKKTKRKNKQT